MVRAPVREYAKPLDRGTRGTLRRPTRRQHSSLKLLTKGRGERAYLGPQMMTVLCASRRGSTWARSSSM
jgi:hypothetical protein